MSSIAADNLESLDNKELRKKCLEYGLPNVPITDTSKKILIRKLRAAMTSGGGSSTTSNNDKSSNKSRRETIQVIQKTTSTIKNSKISSTPDSEKETPKKLTTTVNNRRTIASVAPAAVNEPAAPVTQRRRSGRSTPQQQEPINIVPSSVVNRKPIEPMIIEETDFDDDFILVDDEEMPSQYIAPQPPNPFLRKSRSPSLSKSVVVTTSYAKDTIVPRTILEHDSEVPIESPVEMRTKNYDTSKKPYNASQLTTTSADSYSSRYSSYQPPATSLFYSTTATEKSTDFPSGYKSIYPSLNSATSTETPSKYSYDIGPSSATNRRFTTSGLQQQTVPTSQKQSASSSNYTTNRKTISYYGENSDSNEDDIAVEDEAPYLSDFARRLSRLKAEPLDVGFKKDFSQPRDIRYGGGPTSIGGRRNYSKKNQTLSESFSNFCYALDQKYKIRRNLFLICVFSVIILALYYFYY